MNRIRFLGIAALLSVVACDGLKEALTAHVDVVATAASQELSVQRVADMIGKSQIPVRREVAQSIADVWVSYQLLGKAAAEKDSLTDKKLIEEVMWPVISSARTQKFSQLVSQTFSVDTSNLDQKYLADDILSASHILFPVQGDDSATVDSVMRVAEAVRARTTPANFAQLARQYGTDGTKDQGGDLGVFRANQMVPEFSQAVAAIQPGQVGPLVRTRFGWHIVKRASYDDVKDQFKPLFLQREQYVAESTYIAGLEAGGRIVLEPTLAKTVKEVAEDPVGHWDDGSAVARTRFGAFRARDVARWIQGFPNPQQMRSEIVQADDSLMPVLVRNLLRNELVLHAADSAKVTLDSTEMDGVYRSFAAMLQSAWAGLRISPHLQAADTTGTPADRSAAIPGQIDAYMDGLVAGQEAFIDVPWPLALALREKYDWKISNSGIDRAIQAANTIRAREDSARSAGLPKSQVPMPSPGDSGTRNPQGK